MPPHDAYADLHARPYRPPAEHGANHAAAAIVALEELEKALAEQAATVDELEKRLGPALIDPLPCANGVGTIAEPSSQLVNRIRSITWRVGANDHQLRELTHRLTL